MTEILTRLCTAFDGPRLLATGSLLDVALAVKRATQAGASGPLLVFDDVSGSVIDLDLRGSTTEIAARLAPSANPEAATSSAVSAADGLPAGRGRPKLGVVGREVTLLPRQWEWLAAQPGGASVTLRKLVEAARRSGASQQKTRLAQEAAYKFMTAMAGDLPGFEEATRALFASDRAKFALQIAGWPEAIRRYATKLAFAEAAADPPSD